MSESEKEKTLLSVLTRLLGRVEDFYINFSFSLVENNTDLGDFTQEKGNKLNLGKCFCIFEINLRLHFVGQLNGDAESKLLRKEERIKPQLFHCSRMEHL